MKGDLVRDGVGRIQNLLVIGGTSEIGLAIAERLTGEGARAVVLAARDVSGLDAATRRLAPSGVAVHQLDYRAEMPAGDVVDVIDQATKLVGDLDVVVVSVGILGDEANLTSDTAATESSLRANFLGPALAVQAATVQLATQGHGVLIVLSSVAALRPRADLATYGGAKAGLDAYVRGLQEHIRGSGIHLKLIRPGQVRTRMSAGIAEAPFTVGPAAVAEAVARHLHDNHDIVYVPGVLRLVMAALRTLPAPVFRRVTAAARASGGPDGAAGRD